VEGLLLLARSKPGCCAWTTAGDLAELLEEVHGRLKILADNHSIHLQLGLLEPVTVHGDHERLRRLLLNLVENGIKYTRAGGSVILSLERQGSWALLRVADTGIGLAEPEQEQIFQPFYRSAEALTLSQSGVGLGLSIARSIAQAMAGASILQAHPAREAFLPSAFPGSTLELCNNNLTLSPLAGCAKRHSREPPRPRWAQQSMTASDRHSRMLLAGIQMLSNPGSPLHGGDDVDRGQNEVVVFDDSFTVNHPISPPMRKF